MPHFIQQFEIHKCLFIKDYSSWEEMWRELVDNFQASYPESSCPHQMDLTPRICHAWLEKIFVHVMRRHQVIIKIYGYTLYL